jgi:hypothetical protein
MSPGPAGGDVILWALKALARRQSYAVVEENGADGSPGFRILTQGGDKEARPITPAVWTILVEKGWVRSDANGATWTLSSAGRAHLRRLLSRAPDGLVRPAPAKVQDNTQRAARPGFDPMESPVAWLSRRRDKDGQPLVSPAQLDAAERLRADFWFAGMTPRVTTNWSAALTGCATRRSAPGSSIELHDATIAAGERVRLALRAVGPELSGILIDVCCHLKGLEQVERDAGWPQRSGKLILQLALTRLARHYGLDRSAEAHRSHGRQRIRHWGTEDYRPPIEPMSG